MTSPCGTASSGTTVLRYCCASSAYVTLHLQVLHLCLGKNVGRGYEAVTLSQGSPLTSRPHHFSVRRFNPQLQGKLEK